LCVDAACAHPCRVVWPPGGARGWACPADDAGDPRRRPKAKAETAIEAAAASTGVAAALARAPVQSTAKPQTRKDARLQSDAKAAQRRKDMLGSSSAAAPPAGTLLLCCVRCPWADAVLCALPVGRCSVVCAACGPMQCCVCGPMQCCVRCPWADAVLCALPVGRCSVVCAARGPMQWLWCAE
jgi:hypothetical protein